MTDVIDAEVVKEMQETVESKNVALIKRPTYGIGPIASPSPTEAIIVASNLATALADIIKKQGLYVNIQGREHVRVEGWQTLASLLGYIPTEVSNVQYNGGYLSTVELRNLDGVVITQASAECGTPNDIISKKTGEEWSDRANYAQRSMATTRAISKACANAFRWVMALSGYETTPAEEMTAVASGAERSTGPSQKPSKPGHRSLDEVPCPKCGVKAMIRSKHYDTQEYDGQFLCWKKHRNGGCGTKFTEEQMRGGAMPENVTPRAPTVKDISPEPPTPDPEPTPAEPPPEDESTPPAPLETEPGGLF